MRIQVSLVPTNRFQGVIATRSSPYSSVLALTTSDLISPLLTGTEVFGGEAQSPKPPNILVKE